MRRLLASIVAALVAASTMLVSAAPPPAAALSAGQLQVVSVVSGLSLPLGVTHAGDGSGRLFIVQQAGLVRVVKNGTLQAASFLNLTARTDADGERGLLGLAFHPDFATNRRLFVYYTAAGDGDIIVSRLTANDAGTSVSTASEVIVLEIEHSSRSNHNGGGMAFGPDGYLYLATGDGGGAGDPDDNAQDLDSRLGKILRIDVDGTGEGPNDAYAYPAGNPYVGKPGDDAIWADGLRNPWRIAFDRETDDFWIGDVGQGSWEEIDRDAAPPTGGRDYGWPIMEGAHCYDAATCNQAGKTLPAAEYSHSLGCSVTGGYVYRGPTQRDLQGRYVFGDYCSGRIWTMPAVGGDATLRRDTNLLITSFGESESGELYLTHRSGTLYRVVAPEFTDIATSSFLDDIHWIFYEGLTVGCTPTTFCPTADVTREQMAIFLDRALDLPSTGTDFFSDDEGRTGEASINRLAASGITTGCTPTTYCPTKSVTREQMSAFLHRAFD